ncbi:MAG: ankyrin repeat domain-containing protein [Actinomycetota bacterium]|nr:ankyrin repeat domain-containing protein [Actinomycetota bacterium]
MPDLPARAEPEWLRQQPGDRLAVAQQYGFATWADLEVEVERRDIFNNLDLVRLRTLLADRPEQATRRMQHWCDHRKGAEPVGYLAMLRFDARRLGLPPVGSGTGATVRAVLNAGAPADGAPGGVETPLMTAASYGDAEVAQVLVDAGADLELRAAATAGGVPGGTALAHAAWFGMTEVVDVLVAAGARIGSIAEAAAAGDLSGFDLAGTPETERVAALRIAAAHERLAVIDQLLASGTPVDGVDADGSTALHEAAYCGRPASVRHLLARGADPAASDTTYHSTPLGWCRHQQEEMGDSPGHEQVGAILVAYE